MVRIDNMKYKYWKYDQYQLYIDTEALVKIKQKLQEEISILRSKIIY